MRNEAHDLIKLPDLKKVLGQSIIDIADYKVPTGQVRKKDF
jgi:hypothetical protein